MKRVIVAIDGSECALRAIRHLLAKRALYRDPDELDIHLVNVQPRLPTDVSHFFDSAELAGYHHQESDKALLGARALLDEAGAKYTCHAEIGHVAEVIARLADSLGCDQIVMGTHGRGALAELLAGSTTQKVVHLARIPVLLVK